MAQAMNTRPRATNTRPGWSSERGAQVIEFAIVLPILLVVFAGIVDFGLIFNRYEVVVNAAREGARVGSLPNYTLAQVQTRVNNYLNAGLGAGTSNNATVTMAGTTVTPTVGNPYAAQTVTVALTNGYWLLGPLITLVGGNSAQFGAITLTAQVTMRVQLPGSP
jgi:Flp pilus assembly protein TadG